MAKRIKLTEKQMKKTINEISYGTVDDAQAIGYNTFSDLWYTFYRFNDKLEELEEEFKNIEPSLYQNKNFNVFRTSENNPYMNKIYSLMLKIQNNLSELKTTSDEINGILERKRNQNDNFQNATEKFDNKHADDNISSWDEYRKKEINGE